jgi:hypothetical protein
VAILWRLCCPYFDLDMEFEFNKHQSDEVRLISTDLSSEITIDYAESYNEDVLEFRFAQYALT